ncbi:serine/threonine protein kinase [bacterium]|nr:serine/threonine protein kinase [candidate division CSSED10-310 bacterium]
MTGSWNQGDVLLGEYTVEKILGHGGMGKVYLVKRNLDQALFAVKTLPDSVFKNPDSRKLFIRELGTWKRLAEYPHITACRFFRTVNERLAIFSEYVDGGSLLQWLEERRITQLQIILDIAIQTAWGLDAAHRQGIVHQDVKPANVLMTSDGIAKITDFGLSRASSFVDFPKSKHQKDSSPLVSTRGMTLAYCSPEQAQGEKVSTKTDMWSLGVTLLELFTGSVQWKTGLMAEAALDQLLRRDPEPSAPVMPEELVMILRRCFRENPDERWPDMNALANAIQQVYQSNLGVPYDRRKPEMPNNQLKMVKQTRECFEGVSWEEPKYWQNKLNSEQIPGTENIDESSQTDESSFRESASEDLEGFETAVRMWQEKLQKGQQELLPDFTELLRQKAVIHRHLDDLHGALDLIGQASDILKKLATTSGNPDIYLRWLSVLGNQAAYLTSLNRHKDAIDIYNDIIKISKHPDVTGDDDIELMQYWAAFNQAVCKMRLGDYPGAVQQLEKTIPFLEKHYHADHTAKSAHDLTFACANLAFGYIRRGKPDKAVAMYDKALAVIATQSVDEETQNGLLDAETVAWIFTNKANALTLMNDYSSASKLFDMAIKIREKLVFEKQRTEFMSELGKVYTCKAWMLQQQYDYEKAAEVNLQAIKLFEKLVIAEGRSDLYRELCVSYNNMASIFCEQSKYQDAESTIIESIKILDNLTSQQSRHELQGELGIAQLQLARIQFFSGNTGPALATAKAAYDLLNVEADRTGRADLHQAAQEAQEFLSGHTA